MSEYDYPMLDCYHYWEDEERPAVWLGMLSNFKLEKEGSLRKIVEAWNAICDKEDKLIIKQDAYSIKGTPLRGYISLHRESKNRFSDLSKFWNMYREEVNE